MAKMLSVVATAYNERDTLQELYERLTIILTSLNVEYEIIVVDDGSTDGSSELLQSLAFKDKRFKVVFLSRNFGQHAAIAAGMKCSSGNSVIWLDADLQDVPEEIPKLLAKVEEGYDIVYGIRENRADSLSKRVNAKTFFWLFRKMTGYHLPEGISTFRVLSRRAVEVFNRMPEQSRFTAGMMAWIGFSCATVPIRHTERKTGHSKYSFLKLIRLSLDAFFSFSDYPLKVASNFGIFLAGLSLAVGGYMIVRKLLFGFIISGYASLIVSIFFLAGLQFFFLGITGEYISRIFRDVQGRPLYVIREKVNLS